MNIEIGGQATHEMQEVIVLLDRDRFGPLQRIAWRLPRRFRDRLLTGAPVKAEMMMRCFFRSGWVNVEATDAGGYLGIECPRCGAVVARLRA